MRLEEEVRPRSAGSAAARLVSANFWKRPRREAGSLVVCERHPVRLAPRTCRETTFWAGVSATLEQQEHEHAVGQHARVAEPASPARDPGEREREREAEEGRPADALPEMACGRRARTRGRGRRAPRRRVKRPSRSVSQITTRVVGPSPTANAFAWVVKSLTVLHVDRRVRCPSRRSSVCDVLAQLRGLRRVDPPRQQVGRDEEREDSRQRRGRSASPAATSCAG